MARKTTRTNTSDRGAGRSPAAAARRTRARARARRRARSRAGGLGFRRGARTARPPADTRRPWRSRAAALPGEPGRSRGTARGIEPQPSARPLQEDALRTGLELAADAEDVTGLVPQVEVLGQAPRHRVVGRAVPQNSPSVRRARSVESAATTRPPPRHRGRRGRCGRSEPSRLPIRTRRSSRSPPRGRPWARTPGAAAPSPIVKPRLFVQKSTRRRWRGGSSPRGTQIASTTSPAHWRGAAGTWKGRTRPPVWRRDQRGRARPATRSAAPQIRKASPTASGRSRASRKPVHEVVDVHGVVERPAAAHHRVAPARDRAKELEQARLAGAVDGARPHHGDGKPALAVEAQGERPPPPPSWPGRCRRERWALSRRREGARRARAHPRSKCGRTAARRRAPPLRAGARCLPTLISR